MRPSLVVVVAGVPPELMDSFGAVVGQLSSEKHDVVWKELSRSSSYTDEYACQLYAKLTCKLGQDPFSNNRHKFLESKNLLMMYVDKEDDTESKLRCRFDLEALIKPLQIQKFLAKPLHTKAQKNHLTNLIDEEIRKAIKHSRELLEIIGEEIQKRTHKTCLLLPPKNFGKKFTNVISLVQSASSRFYDPSTFKNDLEKIKERNIQFRDGCHIGNRRQKFKAARPSQRHGTAPLLGQVKAGGHRASCALRGRLRFGTPYDPGFHYDCPIGRRQRPFTSCHDQIVCVPRGKKYVNIAPNDNVRT